MKDEAKEKLGQAIDRVDNAAHGLLIPLPPTMHVEQLKTLLPKIVRELKEAYAEVTGENPWYGEPPTPMPHDHNSDMRSERDERLSS